MHCGFCTATCPTYQILGDELDSPRENLLNQRCWSREGRQIRRPLLILIGAYLVWQYDYVPSGVHYMHLVDHARSYIEDKYKDL